MWPIVRRLPPRRRTANNPDSRGDGRRVATLVWRQRIGLAATDTVAAAVQGSKASHFDRSFVHPGQAAENVEVPELEGR